MTTQLQFPVLVLGFIPPIIGCDGMFNTIRLGKSWPKKLAVGHSVLLMDERSKLAFGLARVMSLEVGELLPLCKEYGFVNHTQLATRGKRLAGEQVFTIIQKIYGPHIATPTKSAAVILLQRINS